MVVDSYDIWRMLENTIGTDLRKMVENRSGFLVVRPDSGDPREVLGRVFTILGDKFGCTTNVVITRFLEPNLHEFDAIFASNFLASHFLSAVFGL